MMPMISPLPESTFERDDTNPASQKNVEDNSIYL